MNILKPGISEFAKSIRNRKIICFGASHLINEMCSFYNEYKLWNNIIAVADNNRERHGKSFRVLWNYVDIISVENMVELFNKDSSIVLLITVDRGNCIQVVKQLNVISDLNEMDCCLYPLFPFCDSFNGVPESVMRLRDREQQIPKVFHYVWVGNPMPDRNKHCIESWKKHCPEYEIKCWNENNYDIEKNKYTREAYNAGKFGYVPDYMRLDIIYEYGGIYLDVDVEVLKKFDDLLYFPAFFGLSNHNNVAAGLGFGARQGNPLLKYMKDVYDDVNFINKDGSMNTAACCYYQTEVLRWYGFTGGNKFHSIQDLGVIFPTEFFCPMSTSFGTIQVTDNCYSYHHYDNTILDIDVLNARIKDRNYMNTLIKGAN